MTNQEFSVLGNYSGSVIMAVLAVLSFIKWMNTTWFFYLLLAFRDLYLVFFFIKRHEATVVANSKQKIMAYASSALPLVYQSGFVTAESSRVATFLFVIGFTVSTLALVDLGYSFGVSPGLRKPIRNGLYRFVSHPMYIGYCIAEIGMIIVAPCPNAVIFLLSVTLYLARASAENNLLKRYAHESTN